MESRRHDVHNMGSMDKACGRRGTESIRGKKLTAQASEALVRGERDTNGARVQEELDMLQQKETIPYVDIDYIRNRIKTELNEDGSALEEVCLCGLYVDKMCSRCDV